MRIRCILMIFCFLGLLMIWPSTVLSQVCGNGLVEMYEECDDGNNSDWDGCGSACVIEHGYECTGEPSICYSTCGDGLIAFDEGCDDGNDGSGDGCSDACQVEDGWNCSGEPSVCVTGVCGNGLVEDDEGCDDGNDLNGDGCDSECYVESGWLCFGEPSVCAGLQCGDLNCDGSVNIGDAVYLVNYVFKQDASLPCADCLR